MHAFDVLGDPVRRRILELLAGGQRSSGEVSEVLQQEFGISQPAVSQHLKVLREHGFASVRPSGSSPSYQTSLRCWFKLRSSGPKLPRSSPSRLA